MSFERTILLNVLESLWNKIFFNIVASNVIENFKVLNSYVKKPSMCFLGSIILRRHGKKVKKHTDHTHKTCLLKEELIIIS